MDVSDSRRIVLLGKTGCGKSSLANTIFGESVYHISHSPVTEPGLSRVETRPVDGRNLTLIDTHSIFDTSGSDLLLKKEIVRCMTECAPGPHGFLIVLKVEKFTKQEEEVIQKIRANFSDGALKFAAVVFTHGDQLPDGQRIEDFVQGNKELSKLVNNCGGRCHVVDNKYWSRNADDDYRNNRQRVAEILGTIDKISEANDGMYYTNKMLQTVKEHIEIEEENMRASTNQSAQEIRNRAKSKVFNQLLRQLVATATGAVLGAFLGVAEHIKSTVSSLGGSDVQPQALATQSAQSIPKAVLSGGLKGALKGYSAGAEAKTVADAFQGAVKAALGK